MLRRIISLVLSFGLLFQQISFAQVAAELNIANYLSRIGSNVVQDKFRPLHLRYFSYDSLNDNFKVLLDKGDLKNFKTPELESLTKTLLNYFLIGVSLPDSMFWVNLRPDSEDQIIDQYLEKTDVGKIMLEADLQLKKDTAAMTSPATPEGKEYWDKLYKKAADLYGYDNVTIPTLTRPWIVPGEIIVRESKDSAYVYKATLKVMLEQDYLQAPSSGLQALNLSQYTFKDERSKALNEYSTQLIRELIIPKLTKEVNSSKRYAALRQVYYSLILSRWFKLRFTGKTGTYASLINTKDLTNLISQDAWSKTSYFKQYQKSFSDGEYNIKEPVYTPTGQVIRSYFSGGINVVSSAINTQNSFLGKEMSFNKLSRLGVLMEGNSGGIKVSAASPVISMEDEGKKTNGQEAGQKEIANVELYPKAIRQDRQEAEVRFDAYATTLNRLEHGIRERSDDKEALQPFINRLIEISTQIEVPLETDQFDQPSLALQSERLRSKIRAFENRFKKAYQVRDDLRLTELNREIVKLLNQRLKIQLQLGVVWLEVAKSDRSILIAAINSLRGARRTSKRISREYGWQRRRETKTMLIEKLKSVGYYGSVIETFLYKDLDIKVYAPDIEYPEGKVTIRQQRHVTVTLADGTKVKERQWRDIPYEDWPSGLRSQIYTLASQEIDYETILHYQADLEDCSERLSEYRKYLPGYIYDQIEESLSNSLIWTKRGSVKGKTDAADNLEFALAKLKEGDITAVLKALEGVKGSTGAIQNLESRLQEIEEIRKGVDRRFESIYDYVRNSDLKEKLTLLKEKLNAGILEEAADLATLVYQNYFTDIVEEVNYNRLQKNIAAISNAIDNLKKLLHQEKLIGDERTLKKRLHNALQAQIKPSKIERNILQKRKKDGLLDEKGIVRLSELESIIRPQEEQFKNNYTAIQELDSKFRNTQAAYRDTSNRLHRDINAVLEFIERQYESNKGQNKPADRSGSSPIHYQDKKSAGSPLAKETDVPVGGIDFRALPMTIQPMGSFNGLNFKLPQLSQAELERINVDSEMQQIKNMVQAGITPSGERIKELIAACVQKKEMNSQADSLLFCVADIFKLEEENASESSPELREALVIVDSQS